MSSNSDVELQFFTFGHSHNHLNQTSCKPAKLYLNKTYIEGVEKQQNISFE
jgi:hypothetical protein